MNGTRFGNVVAVCSIAQFNTGAGTISHFCMEKLKRRASPIEFNSNNSDKTHSNKLCIDQGNENTKPGRYFIRSSCSEAT